MKNVDSYEAWQRERRTAPASPELTDEVMRAVRSEGAPAGADRPVMRPTLHRYAAAAAVVAVAGGMTVIRFGCRVVMMLIVAQKGI